MIQNKVTNINSQCQVVFFNWTKPFLNENMTEAEVSDSNIIDVSKYLSEVSFSKHLGDPAGSFELRLPNDRDWKQILHPGTWGVVYMSQDKALAIPTDSDSPSIAQLQLQKDRVRGIIFIDRVSVVGKTGEEKGEYDADFAVSGRDFGIVYVENEIFYNKFLYEGKIQDAAAGLLQSSATKTVKDLLDTLHRVFFSPDELPGIDLLGGANLQKDIPLQWLLPEKIFQVLQLPKRVGSRGSFFGSIPRENLLKFDETLCTFPVDNPMTQINGKAWDRMKSFSIEQFHELFTETDDNGQPQLNFRYIPWKTSKGTALGRLNPLVRSMSVKTAPGSPVNDQGLAHVVVDSDTVIDFDLGEEAHNRYNYFLSCIDSSIYDSNTTVATLGDTNPLTGFPRIQANSIKRYGLRLMYSSVNALYVLGKEQANAELLKLHNELMLEYWNNSVFMESGTVTIVGRSDIKLGKVLEIHDGVPYNGGKVFYIEGYTDHFTVDDKGAGFWSQSLTVTRGYFPGSIGKRGEDYTESGEFTGTGGKILGTKK